MKNSRFTILLMALLPTVSQAKIDVKELSVSKPVIQVIQVKIASLNDCTISADDDFIKRSGVKPEDVCSLDIGGFENKQNILLQSKVNGEVVNPYVGMHGGFDGKLIYYKNTLPSGKPLTLELKILGEKRGSARKTASSK